MGAVGVRDQPFFFASANSGQWDGGAVAVDRETSPEGVRLPTFAMASPASRPAGALMLASSIERYGNRIAREL